MADQSAEQLAYPKINKKVRKETSGPGEKSRRDALLRSIRASRCLACGKVPPSDPDHVSTRGSGGKDYAGNVWPLCREHHVERHKRGLGHMINKYLPLKDFLLQHGRYDVFERIRR